MEKFILTDNNLEKVAGGREDPALYYVYIIKKGDTLTTIAQKHGCTVMDLLKINGISDSDPITPGDRLYIPYY